MSTLTEALDLLPSRALIIKVGAKTFIPSLVRYVTTNKGRLITVTASEREAEKQKFLLKNYPRARCCVAHAQPESFFEMWEQDCHLLYIEQVGCLEHFPTSMKVKYVLPNNDQVLMSSLKKEGWIQRDTLWENPSIR